MDTVNNVNSAGCIYCFVITVCYVWTMQSLIIWFIMLFVLSDISGLNMCLFLVNDACEKCQNVNVGVRFAIQYL